MNGILLIIFQGAPAGFDFPLVAALTAFIALPLGVKTFLASKNTGNQLRGYFEAFSKSQLGNAR